MDPNVNAARAILDKWQVAKQQSPVS